MIEACILYVGLDALQQVLVGRASQDDDQKHTPFAVLSDLAR